MKTICAWCGAPIAPDENGDGRVSHGLCMRCADQLMPSAAVPLQGIVDRFPIPILVVDGDVTVLTLNRKAQEVLGQTSLQAEDRRGGELFDCVHSRLPGGCGRSIHCAGCALRRAIAATSISGEPQVSIPATLHRNDPDAPSAVALTITTVQQGDFILVRLDKVD